MNWLRRLFGEDRRHDLAFRRELDDTRAKFYRARGRQQRILRELQPGITQEARRVEQLLRTQR